jgi:hypothetical protein
VQLVLHDRDLSTEAAHASARRLLGNERAAALDEGLAPLLLAAFEAPVASALVAERAPQYVAILYVLLALRREHELAPLHDDLWHRAAPGLRVLDPSYGLDTFATDLAQLEAWGCVSRHAEPLRIRGYRDNRRQRFRWQLGEDAVALLEWVEARLAARLDGRGADTRDLLADVLGHLKELVRVLERFRREPDDEGARRAVHLLGVVDDAVHEVSRELLGFRAAMLAFASRPYDLAALKAILAWLERYVGVYLARIETLRTDVAARLEAVAEPRHRRALAEARARLQAELATRPSELRRGAGLRDTDELVDAQRPFFAPGGGLATLCARIDDSAREVLHKMHRHLRELERRSARVAELRAAIGAMATGPEESPGYAALVRALLAAAHHRFDPGAPEATRRVPPPLPRAHKAPERGVAAPRLPEKSSSPAAVRELRARREALLADWLAREVLAGHEAVRLSERPPRGADAPRRWLDTARAMHLAGGRGLARLGVVVDAVAGTARLGDDVTGLEAPDVTVRRREG